MEIKSKLDHLKVCMSGCEYILNVKSTSNSQKLKYNLAFIEYLIQYLKIKHCN